MFVNTPTRPPLGADTWIHTQIMRTLDRSTHEVYAACAKGTPGASAPAYDVLRRIPDVRLTTVNLGPELWGRSGWRKAVAVVRTLPALISFVRLIVLIWRARIDVIHTSDRPRDAFTCVLLGRLTRRPCTIHVHVQFNPWMSNILRWSLRRADHLIAVSEFVGSALRANGIPPERVHVVLNAIDVGAWKPRHGRTETREALQIPAHAPLLLTVCRLLPEKGLTDTIRALTVVRQRHPDTRLLIVGSDLTPNGAFGANLRRLVCDLRLQPNVSFLGQRSDIERLMAAADVYVMPSFEEPFGLVFVEAMAMRLPIVALNNGGTREVVDHQCSGLLSEPGDLEALSANLLTLLEDDRLREQMGQCGREQAERRFDVSRMAADTALVYDRISWRQPHQAGSVDGRR